MNAMSKVTRTLSSGLGALFERKLWSGLLGTSFGGDRDLYAVFGWEKNPEFRHFWFKYHRQDIAKRIVDAPANGIWTDPPLIEADEAFMNAWQDVVSRQSLWMTMKHLDILAGLGNYAVLLVGLDDGAKLETPVKTARQNKVIYLQAYPQVSAAIEEFDENPTSPRFGKPLFYALTPGDLSVTKNAQRVRTTKSIKVHFSRVLHVAENVTENPIYGHSRLEHVYNVLDDLLKITGGSAETYWLAGNRGMQIDIDKDVQLDEDDAADLSDEVDEYMHELRRVIRTRGVKINNLGSDLADPKSPFGVAVSIISGATGIPQRILLGAEAGQLASQQDRANWSERLDERIAGFGEPVMLLPLMRLFIAMNVCPTPGDLTITWPDTFKLNPLERAQTSAQMARSASNLVKALSTPIALDGSGLAEEEVTSEVTTEVTVDEEGNTIPGGVQQTTGKLYKPSTTLITVDEARTIVGFGKHAPVFDDPGDTKIVDED